MSFCNDCAIRGFTMCFCEQKKQPEIKHISQCKKTVEADCLYCDNLDKAIAEARELIKGLSFYTKRVCGENRLDLDLKREYLRRANSWLKDNC